MQAEAEGGDTTQRVEVFARRKGKYAFPFLPTRKEVSQLALALFFALVANR